MVGSLSPFTGDHAYESPPEACNCCGVPKHSDPLGETENTVGGVILTNTESLFVQALLLVTVTKYLVVDVGVAIGLEILALLSDEDGDQ